MIGMSCTHFSNSPLSDWVDPVSETFRHWEIFSEIHHSVINREAEIEDLVSAAGISCSVHAPICDLNVASFSDRLRDASVAETCAVIASSAEIGAKTVTVHPGLASMSVHGTAERAAERAKRSMRVFEMMQREYGVPVAIENMPDVPIFLGISAAALADIVDGTDLGICFDIGHANTSGQIDAMIDTFGDRIVNIHIHDNNGQRDEHLTIGDGNIDFPKVLSRLSRYGGNFIIEAKSLESARASQSRLEKMLS